MRLVSGLSLAPALSLSAFVPAGADPAGTLSNESSSTIVFVYASTCDEDTWGDALLPVDVLEPGSAADTTAPAGCRDFRAVTDSGQELEPFGSELEEGGKAAWTISDG